jgi:hypothetical protein
MCFVWISEQTAIISLYSINLPGFITEEDSVYSAVRTGYLNQSDTVLFLTGQFGMSLKILFLLPPPPRYIVFVFSICLSLLLFRRILCCALKFGR